MRKLLLVCAPLVVCLTNVTMAKAQLHAAGHRLYGQAILSGESFDEGDWFGWSLATGDFDGDGYDDVAVGVPNEDVDGMADAGKVHVLYGRPGGPSVGDALTIDQTVISGFANEAGDNFGWSLAAGDFNGDGYDDLAIGVPNEDLSAVTNAGAVAVIDGSATGLDLTSAELWTQTLSTAGTSEVDDVFGWALAVGDFNDNGVADLAVGVPGEEDSEGADIGGVTVIYGFEQGGLATVASQHWTYLDLGAPGIDPLFDGSTVTAGNFDGLEGDDLAFGSHFSQSPAIVSIFFGTQAEGVQATGSVRFETTDNNQTRVEALDIDGDGKAELAIGLPDDAIGLHGGKVAIVDHEGGNFLTTTFSQDLSSHQTSDTLDAYGTSLAGGDFNGDGKDDLAIGGPGEALNGSGSHHGAVLVLNGSSPCCYELPDQYWTSNDLSGAIEDGDQFGLSMTAGDYNGDGVDDLVIGSPLESVGTTDEAGEITMVFGSIMLFADGFESGDVSSWQ